MLVRSFRRPPDLVTQGALISSAATSKIDWLEMTVTCVDWQSFAKDYLDLDHSLFTEADYGMQGYPDMFVYGKVKLLTSLSKPHRGTKVILSGSALDEVARDAIDIIKLGVKDGASFARIDIALDTIGGGVISFDFLSSEVRKNKDVHRFTQIEFREPLDARTRKPVGRSIQWGGKATSHRFMIAYDKTLERLSAGEDASENWVRFECRWFKAAALTLAFELAAHGMSAAGSLVRGVVDFRECDNDQTDRRSICSWWQSFTDATSIIRTGIKKTG